MNDLELKRILKQKPTAGRVYQALVADADDVGAFAINKSKLSIDLGLSRVSIHRVILFLVSKNIIKTRKFSRIGFIQLNQEFRAKCKPKQLQVYTSGKPEAKQVLAAKCKPKCKPVGENQADSGGLSFPLLRKEKVVVNPGAYTRNAEPMPKLEHSSQPAIDFFRQCWPPRGLFNPPGHERMIQDLVRQHGSELVMSALYDLSAKYRDRRPSPSTIRAFVSQIVRAEKKREADNAPRPYQRQIDTRDRLSEDQRQKSLALWASAVGGDGNG